MAALAAEDDALHVHVGGEDGAGRERGLEDLPVDALVEHVAEVPLDDRGHGARLERVGDRRGEGPEREARGVVETRCLRPSANPSGGGRPSGRAGGPFAEPVSKAIELAARVERSAPGVAEVRGHEDRALGLDRVVPLLLLGRWSGGRGRGQRPSSSSPLPRRRPPRRRPSSLAPSWPPLPALCASGAPSSSAGGCAARMPRALRASRRPPRPDRARARTRSRGDAPRKIGIGSIRRRLSGECHFVCDDRPAPATSSLRGGGSPP